MKSRIYFVIAFFLLVGIQGCQKQLDLKPHDGLVEEELFTDIQGFEYAIRSLYTGMKNDGYGGNDNGMHLMGDLLSDNLMFNPAGRQTKQAYFKWELSPLRTYSSVYYYSYRLASRANTILKNIDNISASEARDNIEGQALAIRGLAHFELLRWFAKIPTQSPDAKTSLGIYYQESFEPTKGEVRRAGTTVASSYERVIADLLAAAEKIATKNPDGYLNKQSVYALLVRVYLYMGEYQKVIEYAEKAEQGPVRMAKLDEYASVWKDKGKGEYSTVIRILIEDKDRIAIGNPYLQVVKTGVKSEYVCRKSFADLFKDEDVRKKASIVKAPLNKKEYWHVSKYLGRGGNRNVVDYKYLRIEEVILSKAEAYAKLGKATEALKVLNDFRQNRYNGFTPGMESGSALFDAIILERRLELAFEGDRYFTLKRLGLGLVRDGNERELADGTGEYALAAVNVPASDHRWVMAIPKDAININPAMADDQNPGY